MPKPKKARNKKYQPRLRRLPMAYCSGEVIEGLRDSLREALMCSEVKLPRGSAETRDMVSLRDTLSWFGVLLAGRIQLDPEEVKSSWELLLEAAEIVNGILEEYRTSGVYRCPDSGLRTVQDACALASDTLSEALRISPQRTIKEYVAMCDIADSSLLVLTEYPGERIAAIMKDPDYISRLVVAKARSEALQKNKNAEVVQEAEKKPG